MLMIVRVGLHTATIDFICGYVDDIRRRYNGGNIDAELA